MGGMGSWRSRYFRNRNEEGSCTVRERTVVLEVGGVHWATRRPSSRRARPAARGYSRSRRTRWPRPRPSPTTRRGPRGASWPAGSGTAATTAPASRCPDHICDPMAEPHDAHAAEPRRAGARDGRARRRHAGMTAQEAMGHGGHHGRCRWPTWPATCATGSWSRPCCRSRSCCGRRSAGTCSASPAGAVRAARRRVLAALFCRSSSGRAWIFFDGAGGRCGPARST